MSKRERILLGVLGVVALWGLWIIFMSEKPQKAENGAAPPTDQYTQVVESLRTALDEAKVSDLEAYRISLADAGADDLPFYQGRQPFYFSDGETGDELGGDALVYSGYLQVGRTAFAIINGIEYAVGDTLAMGGYRLARITPGHVVVERRDEATGRVFKRQIPLAEDDVEDVTLKAVY